MRALSWVAGLVVVLALVVSARSVVSAHPSPTQAALTAARPAGVPAAIPADPGHDPWPQPRFPLPDPSPTPPPPAAAPPAAAAPAPARPAPVPAPAPRPAPPPVVVGSTQQSLINQDRAANGLGPLTWNGCLLSVARSNAARMAGQGFISHTNGPNLDLNCGLGHQAGENVGYWTGGVNDGQLNTMFMNSPEHRANILGPYHYVATDWVLASNGHAYIAVEFS